MITVGIDSYIRSRQLISLTWTGQYITLQHGTARHGTARHGTKHSIRQDKTQIQTQYLISSLSDVVQHHLVCFPASICQLNAGICNLIGLMLKRSSLQLEVFVSTWCTFVYQVNTQTRSQENS